MPWSFTEARIVDLREIEARKRTKEEEKQRKREEKIQKKEQEKTEKLERKRQEAQNKVQPGKIYRFIHPEWVDQSDTKAAALPSPPEHGVEQRCVGERQAVTHASNRAIDHREVVLEAA